jgi:hypothetical protein
MWREKVSQLITVAVIFLSSVLSSIRLVVKIILLSLTFCHSLIRRRLLKIHMERNVGERKKKDLSSQMEKHLFNTFNLNNFWICLIVSENCQNQYTLHSPDVSVSWKVTKKTTFLG